MSSQKTPVPLDRLDAVIFDMDGVVTDTAGVHARCWKRAFDDFLRLRSQSTGEELRLFEDEDYLRYVDGKPRYDGVESFLSSRGITLGARHSLGSSRVQNRLRNRKPQGP